MTAFADLPEDVVYELLCTSPDFAALSLLINVSNKHTYSVFKAHKRSILYAVVSNVIGPCVPNAFKLICHVESRSSDVLTADAIMDALLTLTRQERDMYEEIRATFDGLEALYSQV